MSFDETFDLTAGLHFYLYNINSREEEDVATNMCPCGTTIMRRTHMVGEREIYKVEQDALEDEMRNLDYVT